MANILLLDDSDIAGQAMKGILTRGNHRCTIAVNAGDAWKALRDLIKIDVLFLELKLKGENGIHFIERLRADPFFKSLPVVVYTDVTHQDVVKKALSLKVQNYLIKPYRDESIYGEIAKAAANPWRNLHFDEEKSFCAQMGLTPAELKKMREELMNELTGSLDFFVDCGEIANGKGAAERIVFLNERAEAAGAWGVVDCLNILEAEIDKANWAALKESRPNLDYAARLIFCHLNPMYVPEGFYSEQEKKEKEEAKVRAVWLDADVKRNGPVVSRQEAEKQLDELTACPVINTVAAAFLMNAGGRAPSLNQMMEFVSKDPWLTAQVLIAANHIEREDATTIEDPRTAISLLGDLKLAALAKTMPVIDERHLYFPPITWAHFWTFQMGVARLAHYSSTYLEFGDLTPNAYTAGLLHDFGKLLLVKLYPYGFQAMVAYAKQNSIPLSEAEKKYIGWTSREMGDHFARKQGLPPVFCNVIRQLDTVESAGEDADMVALVSLARHLCQHNHVGYSGNTVRDSAPPIEETPEWQVLRRRVFPSFNLKKFEAQAHAYCAELKQELAGVKV